MRRFSLGFLCPACSEATWLLSRVWQKTWHDLLRRLRTRPEPSRSYSGESQLLVDLALDWHCIRGLELGLDYVVAVVKGSSVIAPNNVETDRFL